MRRLKIKTLRKIKKCRNRNFYFDIFYANYFESLDNSRTNRRRKYKTIKGFKGYADNCAFGEGLFPDKMKAVASIIIYLPTATDRMPEFTEQYFQGKCKNEEIDISSWKETTEKDFKDFFNSVYKIKETIVKISAEPANEPVFYVKTYEKKNYKKDWLLSKSQKIRDVYWS